LSTHRNHDAFLHALSQDFKGVFGLPNYQPRFSSIQKAGNAKYATGFPC
jgi:hypothetical protein